MPTPLVKLIQKATAKQREQRFQSAQEMQLALEAFLTSTQKVTTSAHVARWIAWLRGAGDAQPDPDDQVIDIADLSSANTIATIVEKQTGSPEREEP